MDTIPTFGELVRQYRHQLDLTQAELARRVGCATITIRRIEAGSLRPSRQIAERLATFLKVPEDETEAFIRLARSGSRDSSPRLSPIPPVELQEIGSQDLTGRAIRGYQLGEQLGQGGFGVVYRAIQPLIGRDVALKIILPEFADHPNFIRRFEAEAQVVARLEHPYIVPLYDYWREPNVAYLVMRMMRGGSLKDLLAKGPLSTELILKILSQVGQALQMAHRHGVVHRDVKPANILMDEEQNSYLADFGIAKDVHLPNKDALTQDGILIGSSSYISPEQLSSKSVNRQTDIYSLGILIYEMLSGKRPFDGPTPISIALQHLNNPLPELPENVRPNTSALDAVLARATQKQPQNRFPDVQSFLDQLQTILVSETNSFTLPEEDGQSSVFISKDNPFRGLLPFTEFDAERFYGRQMMVHDLLSQLGEDNELRRFLAVVGPSGSGKSSLVRAGLIPALRSGGLPHSESWFIVDMTPGTQPFENLANALIRVATTPYEVDHLSEQMQAKPAGLLHTINTILPDDGETELLLLVDQFEELFTLVEDNQLREEFLNGLITAILDPKSRLRVVVTLRADFLDRPLQFAEFGELMQRRVTFVVPLSAEELAETIEKPLQRIGLTAEPALVAALVSDVSEQPGSLPLMQFVLTELFEQRTTNQLTLASYRKMGGILGALTHRADELYLELTNGDEEKQKIGRELFLRLITLGEGAGDTRRRALQSELQSLGEKNDIDQMINEFGRYRLLTFDRDSVLREPTVEVAHEALIRSWDRLDGWLNESREELNHYHRLQRAAADWNQGKRDEGYLFRGSQLDQYGAWLETEAPFTLSTLEEQFLTESLAERQRRRRVSQAITWGSGVAAVVMAALAVVALIFARSSNQNAELADEQRNIAQASERSAREAYSFSLSANARQALEADDPELALLLALAANGVDNPPLNSWRTLVDVAYAPGLNHQWSYESGLFDVAVSPDGSSFLTGSKDGTVQLWDSETRELLMHLKGHTSPVLVVEFSPDGSQALSGSEDDTAILWDLDNGEIIHRLIGHVDDVSALDFLPDGKQAITGEFAQAAPSDLILWDLTTGDLVSRFGADAENGNEQGISSIDISSDGKVALVGIRERGGAVEKPLVLWDLEREEVIQFLDVSDLSNIVENYRVDVHSVSISSDGQFGLAGASTGIIYLFDLKTGDLLQRLTGHNGTVLSVQFNADGSTAVSVGKDDKTIWWRVDTGSILHQFETPVGEGQTIQFLNESQAIGVGWDGKLSIWDLSSNWRVGSWGEEALRKADEIWNIDISPNGDQVAVSTVSIDSAETRLLLLEEERGNLIREFKLEEGERLIADVEFSPDGSQLLASFLTGTLVLWDTTTGSRIQVLEGHRGEVRGLDISADGQYAVSASLDNTVIYWDLNTGEVLQRMVGHLSGSGISGVTFINGDRYAASSSDSDSIIVWDLETGEQIKRLTGLTGDVGGHMEDRHRIERLRQSPDGRHLLSVSSDGTLVLWDIASGKSVKRFIGHGDSVRFLQFFQNGESALSSAQNNTLILWDIDSGIPVREFLGGGRANAFTPVIGLHPNEKTFLTDEPPSGKISRWQLKEPTPMELINWIKQNRHLRELTCQERSIYQIEPLCEGDSSLGTTADLFTTTELGLIGYSPPNNNHSDSTDLGPIELEVPDYPTFQAELGKNQGALTRHSFDKWMFEGKAGDVISLEMIADQPATDRTVSLENRFEAGLLDTLLMVIRPDGEILGYVDDLEVVNGEFDTNAKISAISLPLNGTYEIQARSYLDDGAGNYTLHIEPVEITVDPDVLESYVGEYLEGPWEYDVVIYVEDGQLVTEVIQLAQTFVQIPINENEFVDREGNRIKFIQDENGNTIRYDLWVSPIHPVGGQWYQAPKKIEDE